VLEQKAQKRNSLRYAQQERDLQGKLLVDQMVWHIFQIENGLVGRFDIRGA
jgi:hypothetical protein